MSNDFAKDFFKVDAKDKNEIKETKQKMDEILTGDFVDQVYLNNYTGNLNMHELFKLQSEIKSLLHNTELEIANRIKNGQYSKDVVDVDEFDPVTLENDNY